MLWSNDVVLEFVELYRREQLLWDPKHPSHRNRSEIADAWLRIQESLSTRCSVLELKRKKESLMTSFRMHFAKKKKLEGYKTTWFAYPLLESFLGGKYECDSTVNQMENEFFAGSALPVNSRKRNVTERNNATNRQHKAHMISTTNESDISSKQQRVETAAHSADDDFDECELYGQLLAKKLRKLDERHRDIAMHEIDNIMFRIKMQNGSSQGKTFASSPPSPGPQKVQSSIFIVTPENHHQYEDEDIPYQDHTDPS